MCSRLVKVIICLLCPILAQAQGAPRGANPVTLALTLQHTNCAQPCSGTAGAVITANRANSVDFWVWKNEQGSVIGNTSDPSISGLCPGRYSLEVTYTHPRRGTNVLVRNFRIGSAIKWINKVDVTCPAAFGPGALQGTTVSQGTARSSNLLLADQAGWASFKFTDPSNGPGDYLAMLYISNGSGNAIPGSPTIVVDDIGITGGNRLNIRINNGTTVRVYRMRAAGKVRLRFNGAGGLRVSFRPFGNPNQSPQRIRLPAYDCFVIDAELGISPNCLIEEAIASFGCLPGTYVDLKKKLDGGYAEVKDGMLRFLYDEHYHDQNNALTYHIYDEFNTLIASDADFNLNPDYGDNRFELDLSCDGIGLAAGMYKLEVINEKAEKQYLRFKNTQDYQCGP